MSCLDANIWVSYLDADLAEHDAVAGPVTEVLETRPLFVPTVVQMEVVHYLTKQLRNSRVAVDRFLAIEDATVPSLRSGDVADAAALLRRHERIGIGGRDAVIVASMDRRDVSTLWTDDAGLVGLGDRLDWLSVVDPVDDAG